MRVKSVTYRTNKQNRLVDGPDYLVEFEHGKYVFFMHLPMTHSADDLKNWLNVILSEQEKRLK